MVVLTVIGLVLLCFSLVVFVGPPYLPTLTPQVEAALDMLELEPGQTMIELGCGDGKVLVAAAERGWRVVGIELNPILAAFCWLRTRRYHGRVKIVWGNYWSIATWPPAEGIFGFVLPRYMTKLDESIKQWLAQSDGTAVTMPANGGRRTVRLASFAFKIPGKKVVREERGVFLYKY
jgi:SAM-dependent methyltransferase